MLQILVLVCFVIACLGALLVWKKNPTKFSLSIGMVLFLGAIIVSVIAGIAYSVSSKNARADRASRTTTLTGTAVEVRQEFMEDKNVWLFHLKVRKNSHSNLQLSETFSDPGPCVLKNGDVVRIKFVAPEKPEGKPEVLEFLNLTCEIDNHALAPPVPEEYPTRLPEAPPTSPEAPARSRARTLPAPNVE